MIFLLEDIDNQTHPWAEVITELIAELFEIVMSTGAV
jgi:hypothetical protein